MLRQISTSACLLIQEKCWDYNQYVQGSLGNFVSLSVQLASAYDKLGNIDANTGDAQTGWDTDQFLTDPKEALLVAATILKQGGLAPGDMLPLASLLV